MIELIVSIIIDIFMREELRYTTPPLKNYVQYVQDLEDGFKLDCGDIDWKSYKEARKACKYVKRHQKQLKKLRKLFCE
jgi:hypothetical protein